jgi:DNA-binding transcriptional MocR family regulator
MQNNYNGRICFMPVNSFDNYPMSWKPSLVNAEPPLYKALANMLEEDIRNGSLKPGDMLPPQRELADYLDVNLSTISRAFKLCEQRGIISAKVGKGTYISADANINSTLLSPSINKGLINMGATHPIYEQNKYVAKFIDNMMKKPDVDSFFKYSSPAGTYFQKTCAKDWLKRVNINTSEENISIAAGGQNALCAVLSALFEPGDKIGTDPLTYSGIKTLAKMLGIQLVPIEQKNNEMSPTALRNHCKNDTLKGIYLIPDYQNPTTHVMSYDTRKEISDIAKEYNIIVIEDGINSLLTEKINTQIKSLAEEQTIYISSTSKSLCAGLRNSFIVSNVKYKNEIDLALYNINMMVSPFTAQIVCELITSQIADKIVDERKEATLERNRIGNSILKGYELLGDDYCNFRFLILPKGWSGRTFETCAKNAGVEVYCSERFAVGSTSAIPAVRLSLTAPKDIKELEQGLNILRSILNEEDKFTMF